MITNVTHPAHMLLQTHGHLLPADGAPVSAAEFARRVDMDTLPDRWTAYQVAVLTALPGSFRCEGPGVWAYDENAKGDS